jgi:DNA polymerase-4
MPRLCRDCLCRFETGNRCPDCRSPRVVAHPELFDLSIAHMDCDAFYASVEKRDNLELRDQAVIVGGGHRGVVSTACYLARIKGVRSAMPMFQALKLCPEAVVVKPRMRVYVEVSRQIRSLMEALTPAIQPLSLDEAFMDLSGTERLHGAPPAVMLARLLGQIEAEVGVTGSIGLSHNKFLAKIASDQDKPRGFSVIGRAETEGFLARQSVRIIWGVGTAAQTTLEGAGIRTIADLLRWDRRDLAARFGQMGDRLWHLARGQDDRAVVANEGLKSISNETTFFEDTADIDRLLGYIWRLSVQVSDRGKAKGLGGGVVTLKLKRGDFKLITRSLSPANPVQFCDQIYPIVEGLFRKVADQGPFRLIGVGIGDLKPFSDMDAMPDLLDPQAAKRQKAEAAIDALRQRFGSDAVIKGRALR